MTILDDLNDAEKKIRNAGNQLKAQLARMHTDEAEDRVKSPPKEKKRSPKILESFDYPGEYFICDDKKRNADWLSHTGEWIRPDSFNNKIKARGCYFASREIAEDMIEAWIANQHVKAEEPEAEYVPLERRDENIQIPVWSIRAGRAFKREGVEYMRLCRGAAKGSPHFGKSTIAVIATEDIPIGAYRIISFNADILVAPVYEGKDHRKVTKQAWVGQDTGKRSHWHVHRRVDDDIEYLNRDSQWVQCFGNEPEYEYTEAEATTALNEWYKSKNRPNANHTSDTGK